MTTENPRTVDLEVAVPGTPEQVWAAIATGPGISSWLHPTRVDEHVGGAFGFDMGGSAEDAHAAPQGTVTGYDAPTRFATEASWSAAGETTTLATEWLVAARDEGSCTVRMVTAASDPATTGTTRSTRCARAWASRWRRCGSTSPTSPAADRPWSTPAPGGAARSPPRGRSCSTPPAWPGPAPATGRARRDARARRHRRGPLPRPPPQRRRTAGRRAGARDRRPEHRRERRPRRPCASPSSTPPAPTPRPSPTANDPAGRPGSPGCRPRRPSDDRTRAPLALAVLTLPALLVSLDLSVLLVALPRLSASSAPTPPSSCGSPTSTASSSPASSSRWARSATASAGAAAVAGAVAFGWCRWPRRSRTHRSCSSPPARCWDRRRDAHALGPGAGHRAVPGAPGQGVAVAIVFSAFMPGGALGPARRRRAARALLVGLGVPARRRGDGPAPAGRPAAAARRARHR